MYLRAAWHDKERPGDSRRQAGMMVYNVSWNLSCVIFPATCRERQKCVKVRYLRARIDNNKNAHAYFVSMRPADASHTKSSIEASEAAR